MVENLSGLGRLRQAVQQTRIKGLLKQLSEELQCQAVAVIKHDIYAWPTIAQYSKDHVFTSTWRKRPPLGQMIWVEHFYLPQTNEYILRCQITYDGFPLGQLTIFRQKQDFDEEAAIYLDYSSILCSGFNHQYVKSMRIQELLQLVYYNKAIPESELSLLTQQGYALVLRPKENQKNLRRPEPEEDDFFGYLIHSSFEQTVVHAFLNNGDLLLFVDTDAINSFIEQLAFIASENNRSYIMGISGKYPQGQLAVAFAEAKHAAGIGDLLSNEQQVFFFHDLGIYRLFNYPDNGWTINQMLDEMTEKLDMLDSEKKQVLTKTLTCLVKHNYNYSKASEELYAHPNTIRYRISLLEEMWGKDLSRDEDRLLFSLIGKLLPLWKKYTKYSQE